MRSLIVGCVALFLCLEASIAYAQSASASAGADHKTVFEIGWAGAWSHAESWQPYGITFAVEKTPIEGLLEIEAGVSVSRSRGTTATSVDFLLKKPWTLSRKVEFMAGVGPELVHADSTFMGVSAVADLMVWPSKNVGWYLEPGWEVDFQNGTTRRGLAIAAGLIIGR